MTNARTAGSASAVSIANSRSRAISNVRLFSASGRF